MLILGVVLALVGVIFGIGSGLLFGYSDFLLQVHNFDCTLLCIFLIFMSVALLTAGVGAVIFWYTEGKGQQ